MDEHGAKRKARAWPQAIAAGRRVAAAQRETQAWLLHGLAGRIQSWALADVGPGRLMPWLPVAFGLGIVLYFSAEREPAWWAGLAVALAGAVGSVLARNRPIAFPVLLALTAMAAGFSVATLKTLRVAHPILTSPAFSADVTGFVEVREQRERSDRIVVRVSTIEAARLSAKPERIRVSVRKGSAPAVGTYVSFRARLNPPLSPLRPGGYDFARDLYFQRIGAIGYVFGRIATMEPPEPPGGHGRHGGVRPGNHFNADFDDTIPEHVNFPGGGFRQINDPAFHKRSAVIDATDDGFCVFQVRYPQMGSPGVSPMGAGKF